MQINFIKKFFYAGNEINLRNLSLSGIGIVSAALIALSISRAVYPFDLGNYESAIWTPALYSINGSNPYGYALQPPYIIAPYGYLFYLIIGAGLKIFGYQFWFGRIFAALAAFTGVFCVGKCVALAANRKLVIYAAMLSVLSSFAFQNWLAQQRSDFPALALAFLGLTLALYEARSETSSAARLVSAVLLLTGALFIKQTVFLPVVIAALGYLQSGKIKSAIFTFASVALLAAAFMLALYFTSDGGYYFEHFYIVRGIPYSYSRSIIIAKTVFLSFNGVIVYLIIFLYAFQSLKSRRSDLYSSGASGISESRKSGFYKTIRTNEALFACYFILSFIVSFIASARAGSSINYYLEFTLATSIVFGIALDKLRFIREHKKLYAGLITALVLFSGINIFRFYRGEYFRWQSASYYREMVETVNKSVAPDSVNISVYPEIIALANRKYDFSDLGQYVDGRSSDLAQVFRSALLSGRYSAIILADPKADYLLPECRLAPMKPPATENFYRAYLYICTPPAAAEQ